MKMRKSSEQLVTVYITNYNYEDYLKQSIESVLNQTYTNFELLIIDDGSTDGSKKVIDQYIENPRVRVIYQKNKGLIKSNNVAIKAGKGAFIMRLDADDYLDKNCLLIMMNTICEDKEIGLVFPDYYYIDKFGKVLGQERRNDFDKEVILFDQPAHGACTLLRKEFLLEVGGYSGEFDRQDGWDIWFKFINRYKIKNINLPLFYYRKHESNLTSHSKQLLETRSKIYKKYADKYKKKDLKVLAILSVRGKFISNDSQELSILGQKPVICWTIDSLLESNMIQEIIVSTSDLEIIKFIEKKYQGKINLVKREIMTALENTSHEESVINSIKKRKILDYDTILEITPDYPLRNQFYIEKAINVMRVHDVDRVIGVSTEDSVFYKHSGAGLKIIGNDLEGNKLRLEREYLYRHTGGISLSKKDYYKKKNKDHKSIILGHIIISPEASTRVSNKLELEIAKVIMKETKNA